MSYRLYLNSEITPPARAILQGTRGRQSCWLIQDLDPARDLLQKTFAQQSCAALLPDNFSPKAIFFDMDATVIQEESIDEMAQEMNVGDEIRVMTQAAMAGYIKFGQALEQRLGILRGMPLIRLLKVASRLTLNPGIETFIKKATANQVPCFVVSGGFSIVINHAAQSLPLRGIKANTLEFKGDRLTGRIEGPIIDAAEKRDFVLMTAESLGIKATDCVAVGDGANDKLMMEVCGLAFGFKPKPVLLKTLAAASFVGNHQYFSDLLWP